MHFYLSCKNTQITSDCVLHKLDIYIQLNTKYTGLSDRFKRLFPIPPKERKNKEKKNKTQNIVYLHANLDHGVIRFYNALCKIFINYCK